MNMLSGWTYASGGRGEWCIFLGWGWVWDGSSNSMSNGIRRLLILIFRTGCSKPSILLSLKLNCDQFTGCSIPWWNALSRNIIVTKGSSWNCRQLRNSFGGWWGSTSCAYLPFCGEKHWSRRATTPLRGDTIRSPRICCKLTCLTIPRLRIAPHSRSKATYRIIHCTFFSLFASDQPCLAWKLRGCCMRQKLAGWPGARWARLLWGVFENIDYFFWKIFFLD